MFSIDIKLVGDKKAREFIRRMGRTFVPQLIRIVTGKIFREAKKRTPRSYGEYRDLSISGFNALKDSWQRPKIKGNEGTFQNVSPYAFVLEEGRYPPGRVGTPKKRPDRLGSRKRTITLGRDGKAFSKKGFVRSDPEPGGMIYPLIHNKKYMDRIIREAIVEIRRKMKRRGGAAIL